MGNSGAIRILITLTDQLGASDIETKKIYSKQPDSIHTLRRLIRELQNDAPFNKSRQKLFEIGIIKHDLIKIVEQWCKNLDEAHDDEIKENIAGQEVDKGTPEEQKKEFNVVLRFLLNLTQPIEECFKKNHEEEEGGDRNPEVVKAKRDCEISLREVKKAFISDSFWNIYQKRLKMLIETEQIFIDEEADKEVKRQ